MPTLYQELTTDPTGAGYDELMATGSHNKLADLLNAKTVQIIGAVSVTEALIWMAAYGVPARLRAGMQSGNAALAAYSEIALMLANNPNVQEIDLGRADVRGMLTALKDGNVISIEAHDALLAKAQKTVSRAEVLWGRAVTVDEVSAALAEV